MTHEINLAILADDIAKAYCPGRVYDELADTPGSSYEIEDAVETSAIPGVEDVYVSIEIFGDYVYSTYSVGYDDECEAEDFAGVDYIWVYEVSWEDEDGEIGALDDKQKKELEKLLKERY